MHHVVRNSHISKTSQKIKIKQTFSFSTILHISATLSLAIHTYLYSFIKTYICISVMIFMSYICSA